MSIGNLEKKCTIILQHKKYEFDKRKFNRDWFKQNDEIRCVKNGIITYDNNAAITNEFKKNYVNSILALNSTIPNVDYVNSIKFNLNASFEFIGVSISEVKHCIE